MNRLNFLYWLKPGTSERAVITVNCRVNTTIMRPVESLIVNAYNYMLSGEEEDVEPDSDDEVDNGDNTLVNTSARAMRSAYVDRGNVQAVREARKRAGLSESFPRSDPLITKFAAFLQTSGAAANDVNNKTERQTVGIV